jgi:hypothetical protein
MLWVFPLPSKKFLIYFNLIIQVTHNANALPDCTNEYKLI